MDRNSLWISFTSLLIRQTISLSQKQFSKLGSVRHSSLNNHRFQNQMKTHSVFISDCKLLSKLPQGQWITQNPLFRAHESVNVIRLWPPDAHPSNFSIFALVLVLTARTKPQSSCNINYSFCQRILKDSPAAKSCVCLSTWLHIGACAVHIFGAAYIITFHTHCRGVLNWVYQNYDTVEGSSCVKRT